MEHFFLFSQDPQIHELTKHLWMQVETLGFSVAGCSN